MHVTAYVAFLVILFVGAALNTTVEQSAFALGTQQIPRVIVDRMHAILNEDFRGFSSVSSYKCHGSTCNWANTAP